MESLGTARGRDERLATDWFCDSRESKLSKCEAKFDDVRKGEISSVNVNFDGLPERMLLEMFEREIFEVAVSRVGCERCCADPVDRKAGIS